MGVLRYNINGFKKKLEKKWKEECHMGHSLKVSVHFSERVLERGFNPKMVNKFVCYAIPRYCFSITVSKSFALILHNQFIVVGAFRNGMYVLDTILEVDMVYNAEYVKILKV